jgi:hypothetical protein
MFDSEVRPKVGSNRNKFFSALAVELGLPVDILEQALEKVKRDLEQNGDNILDNSSPSSPTNANVHNNIQESELVDELSRSNQELYPSLNNELEIHKSQKESSSQSLKKNRKGIM